MKYTFLIIKSQYHSCDHVCIEKKQKESKVILTAKVACWRTADGTKFRQSLGTWRGKSRVGGGVKRSYVVICMVAPISVVADLF